MKWSQEVKDAHAAGAKAPNQCTDEAAQTAAEVAYPDDEVLQAAFLKGYYGAPLE